MKQPKAVGRPKKTAESAKTEVVEFRVGVAEKMAFEEAAEMAGIGLSTWVRERLRRASIRELEEAGRIAAFLRPRLDE